MGAYCVSPLRAPGRERGTAHTDSTSTEIKRVRERQYIHTQRKTAQTQYTERGNTHREKDKDLDKLHKYRFSPDNKLCAICELDNTGICGIM